MKECPGLTEKDCREELVTSIAHKIGRSELAGWVGSVVACFLIVGVVFWNGYIGAQQRASEERKQNEQRVYKVESCIEGIKSDVGHLKAGQNRIEDKVDKLLEEMRKVKPRTRGSGYDE